MGRTYIDRQAALDMVRGLEERYVNNLPPMVDKVDVCNALDTLPSADVQPVRHGFWIEDRYNDLDFVCSECGEPCANMVMGMPRDRYCKWCGARMDGEQDG